jgi:beta-galactosidase beta subunit
MICDRFENLKPHDIHHPGCHLRGKYRSRKIVMKFAAE